MSTPSDQMPPPSPPPASFDTPNTAAPTNDRNLAMLTHLSGFILSVIVPLVVWLMNKDRSDKAYLTGEAREALNFQITMLIGYAICFILRIILIGYFLHWCYGS